MLSVAGGKLTTYRTIALDALERLRGPLGLRRIDRSPFPLPADGAARSFPVELDPEVEAHLRHLYGSRYSSSSTPWRIRRCSSGSIPRDRTSSRRRRSR